MIADKDDSEDESLFIDSPVLVTQRLIMRAPRNCDIPALVKLADNLHVAQMLADSPAGDETLAAPRQRREPFRGENAAPEARCAATTGRRSTGKRMSPLKTRKSSPARKSRSFTFAICTAVSRAPTKN